MTKGRHLRRVGAKPYKNADLTDPISPSLPPRARPELYWAVAFPIGLTLGTIALFALSALTDITKAGALLLTLIALTWVFMVVLAAPNYHGGSLAATWLESPDRRTAYDRAMHPLLSWSARWLHLSDDPPPRGWRVAWQTLNWPLLHKAMLWAVVYPIALLILQWAVFGADTPARIGSLEVIPAEPRHWRRAVTIGGIALMIFALIMYLRSTAKGLRREFWLLIAFTGAATVAGTVAFVGTITVASAGAFVGSGSGTLESAVKRGYGQFFVALFVLVVFLLLRWLISAKPWADASPQNLTFLPFIGILPALNALFDFLSLGITLTLIRLGHGRGFLAVLCGLADVCLAGLLFLASGCTLIWVIHWMNITAGVSFVSLADVFANIGDWRTYGWVYAMVFSTVIPTLLHALLAALTLFPPPRVLPRALLGHLVRHARFEIWAMAAAAPVLTIFSSLWIALLCAVLAVAAWLAMGIVDLSVGLPWSVADQMADALHWYLGWFPWFGEWIGALPGAPVDL